MVTSAALMLREYGVAGTSFAKVLDHAEAPRGSVGFHFPGGKNQLVTEAIAWAGGLVTRALSKANTAGQPADRIFAMICDIYRQQLSSTNYAAGCPVGAVAQEGYGDPELRAAVQSVLADWRRELSVALRTSGHDTKAAAELADLCIAALEGAILIVKVDGSVHVIDVAERRIMQLVRPR